MRTHILSSTSLVIGTALALAIGCGADIVVHSARNPTAVFDHYHSFSFGAPEAALPGYTAGRPGSSADVRARVQPAVAAALADKGYVAATDKGDLVILVGAGRRTVPMTASSDVASEWLPDDENADFVEGAVVIDVVDASTGRRVWHGASRAQVDTEHLGASVLRREIVDLLATFPAARAS